MKEMTMRIRSLSSLTRVAAVVTMALALHPTLLFAAQEGTVMTGGDTMAWWAWPLILLVLTFVMGILAAMGGVGGGGRRLEAIQRLGPAATVGARWFGASGNPAAELNTRLKLHRGADYYQPSID